MEEKGSYILRYDKSEKGEHCKEKQRRREKYPPSLLDPNAKHYALLHENKD